ncbi:MAG: hypothetical protein Q9216_001822 [Gyalolechia sp. 2 TL-2023]
MLLSTVLTAFTYVACQCIVVTARPTVEKRELVNRNVPVTEADLAAGSDTFDTSELVHGASISLEDMRLTLQRFDRLDKRVLTRPSPALNLVGSIRYHVPETDVTLFLDPGRPYPQLQYAFRVLLSKCLVEVENIIDVAGDGIIPGFRNKYQKVESFEDEHVTSDVQLQILSYHISGPEDRLMTYGVLLNTLKGLWRVMIIDALGQSMAKIMIDRTDKGTVGFGYIGVIRQPTVA